MEIWTTLKGSPKTLKAWYAERWHSVMGGDKKVGYGKVRRSYNSSERRRFGFFVPLLLRGRGAVSAGRRSHVDALRDSQAGSAAQASHGGWMSGAREFPERSSPSRILPPRSRVPSAETWCTAILPTQIVRASCTGRSNSALARLFDAIAQCKRRGVYVALSIDGTKKSGSRTCPIMVPRKLFEREVLVNCGRSMLRRFQMNGQTLEDEIVADRLLLTY